MPNAWQIVGAGDFNGDGTDDILWRNNDGTVANWLMSNGQYTGAGFGYIIPNSWIVVA
jgi:hypothetical protein